MVKKKKILKYFLTKFSLFPASAMTILEQYMHIEYDWRFYGLFKREFSFLHLLHSLEREKFMILFPIVYFLSEEDNYWSDICIEG